MTDARDEKIEKLEAEISQLKATLELRTRTMNDINAALVAALDRAEAAEAKLESK